MKTKITLLIIAVLLSVYAFAQNIHPHYTDGKIYVRVKSNTSVNVGKVKNWNNLDPNAFSFLKPLIGTYGITKVAKPFFAAKDDDILQRTYVVCFNQHASVNNLIASLEQTGLVELAERVPLMKTSLTPNDYNSTQQWFLAKINAPQAWDVFSSGSNIPVAVVDNAMQTNHPDLSANMYVNAGEVAGNGIDDDNNGYIDDVTGYDIADDDANPNPPNTSFDHGTHCSGLVSARTGNNTGIASIGYSVKVIPVKCTGDASDPTGIDAGYAGVIYSVIAKARVISCSWGGAGSSSTEQAVMNYAWNHNSIVIAAAGNDNTSTQSYPAAYNNVYCVASTTSTDARSSFSNYGTWVDIAAPGSTIRSTLPGSTYGNMSGTSMATPIVAGLAGLILSKSPYLTPTQVLNCISTTAATLTATGMGAGRIDAAAAMNCAAGATPPLPTVDFIANKTVTCPGAPVQFTDNTFYLPTSWSWSFPGGTPSTSTSQNPIVTYATPGTYQVQLTAGNVNGNGTQTKNAYITVSGPSVLPLVEGFTSTVFPPVGWADVDFFNDSVKWYRSTAAGGFSATGQCMFFDNYNSDTRGKSDKILTPKYDFTALSSATMTFDVAYARYDAQYSDTLEVLVSTDCGQTYTTVYSKGGTTLATAADLTTGIFDPTATEWRTETINLNSYVGQGNVLVAFSNIGRYGQAIYVDNVNISGVTSGAPPTAVFTNNANFCSGQTLTLTDQSTNNPTSWTWSTSGGTLSSTTAQSPTITFATSGTYTVTLVATNSFGSSSPVSQTYTINATPNAVASNSGPFCVSGIITLNGNGSGTYAWSGPASFSSTLQNPTRTNATLSMGGTYTLTVTSNGCSAISTTSVIVNNRPTASLTGPSSFCAGDSITLSSAGSSTGGGFVISGYQWQLGGTPISGATSVTYSATQAGVYSVIVSNSGGCSTTSANKTVTVNALPNVAALASPGDTICSGDQITLSGSGAASYSWDNGVSNGVAFAPTSTTTYLVTGTDGNNCSNTASIEIVVNPCIGIKESNAVNSISLIPNPNNGSFSINYSGNDGINVILITNAIGQTIKVAKSDEADKIELNNVSTGIYFANIILNNGEVKTLKFIVK